MIDFESEISQLMAKWQLKNDSDLADFLGLTKSAVSHWRRGKTELGFLTKVKVLDKLGYMAATEVLARLLPESKGRALIQAERARGAAAAKARFTEEDLARELGVSVEIVRPGELNKLTSDAPTKSATKPKRVQAPASRAKPRTVRA